MSSFIVFTVLSLQIRVKRNQSLSLRVMNMMSGRMLMGARVVQGARVDPSSMYPGTLQYSGPQ